MAVMVRSCQPANPLRSNHKRHYNQMQPQQKSRIPIMQHKNPPMLVALKKPDLSGHTSLSNTAQFSIRRVERVNSLGKRVDRRQHSDAFEKRHSQAATEAIKELTSLSLENTGNILYCVRDSKELHHAKLASSTSHNHIVEKSYDQAEILYKEIQHPKAFKHSSPTRIKEILPASKKNKTYSEMYLARQHQLDKAERATHRRRQEMISKQQQTQFLGRVSLSPEVKQSSFPHTLPSAMYGPPHNVAEYSALYNISPLPPIPTAQHHPQLVDVFPRGNTTIIQDSKPVADKTIIEEEETPKEGYSVPKKKITYKPYTLKDALAAPAKVGGLGPDTENTQYKMKLEKANRQIEYANKIRNEHKKKDFPKRVSNPAPIPPPPPSKATIGKLYASTLPLPKPGKPKWDNKTHRPLKSVSPVKESTVLQEEILKQRLKTHREHKRILEELHNL